MVQPSNVEVTPINRAFLAEQGILKGMGSGLKKRKMQDKKKQPKQPMMNIPRIIDTKKIAAEDVKAQGGKTPSSVMKQIESKRAYDVKYGPGLYKKAKKK